MDGKLFDFYSQEVVQDPYPVYAKLRTHNPVFRLNNDWIVTRYKDVSRVISDWHMFSSSLKPSNSLKELLTAGGDTTSQSLNAMDPPAHSRLRKPISAYFASPHVTDLDGEIEKITNDLLESMLQKPEGDVMSDIAGPLSMMMTSRVLGLKPEVSLNYKRWTEGILYADDLALTQEQRRRIRLELRRFFEDHTERVRKGQTKGILNELLPIATQEEITGFGMFLLIAGMESISGFLGNVVVTLFKHPELLKAVSRNTDLVPELIEAVSRYDGPTKSLARVTTTDVELSGITIPRGCRVVALIGSANRDPEVFSEPDRIHLDGARTARHLTFSAGPHRCPGDDLARVQMIAILKKLVPLLAELPPLDLPSVKYRVSTRARSPKHLDLPFHCSRGNNRA